MERWQIEQLRRSLAMVAANCVAPLTTEQAEQLVRALDETDAELRRLRDGLRALLSDGPDG